MAELTELTELTDKEVEVKLRAYGYFEAHLETIRALAYSQAIHTTLGELEDEEYLNKHNIGDD